MIKINEETDCCGCASCMQRCPEQCILMKEDVKGFLYPFIDKTKCIDCGLCEKVCPVQNQDQSLSPIQVQAVRNKKEEIRMSSSSGGYFHLLAEKIISRGGVVFGAAFDDQWEVHHTYAETIQGLQAFLGSKYVQSRIENTFSEAEEFLKLGRLVLYSGTSCQIAGLKKYLRKTYDNLFTVETVCHGVPSPKIWRDYLDSLPLKRISRKHTVLLSLKDIPVITGMSFRDKSTGWKKFSLVISGITEQGKAENMVLPFNNRVIVSENAWKNIYMKAFLNNLSLRPICFTCPAKSGKCHSDFSLSDFWAVDRYCPQFNDDKGITLVHLNSKSAIELDKEIEADRVVLNPKKVYNRSFVYSAIHKFDEAVFWKEYLEKGLACIDPICTTIHPSLIQSLIAKIRNFIKIVLLHRN